ncbi:MAG TPA: DUF1338 family protein, partial [Tianweitania sediminis]|nr:DUF1338 family protein [Tianweitania sediminis]
EPVSFQGHDGAWHSGSHTARFGEIEQRGIALTPKGRALYDRLLDETRAKVRPAADGSNAAAYVQALRDTFRQFPDDWAGIRAQGLGYFTYSLNAKGKAAGPQGQTDIETLLANGLVRFDPVTYEDFLPVSAAGIFQSNLGDHAAQAFEASPNQKRFEADLGVSVLDEFAHYAAIEQASIDACRAALGRQEAAE